MSDYSSVYILSPDEAFILLYDFNLYILNFQYMENYMRLTVDSVMYRRPERWAPHGSFYTALPYPNTCTAYDKTIEFRNKF